MKRLVISLFLASPTSKFFLPRFKQMFSWIDKRIVFVWLLCHKTNIFYPKITILLHACVTYSELPSHLSTMVWRGVEPRCVSMVYILLCTLSIYRMVYQNALRAYKIKIIFYISKIWFCDWPRWRKHPEQINLLFRFTHAQHVMRNHLMKNPRHAPHLPLAGKKLQQRKITLFSGRTKKMFSFLIICITIN